MVFKCLNGLAPPYLCQKFKTRSEVHNCNTRNSIGTAYICHSAGAPNGSVPQNICSSGTFLLAGRCGRNNSPWKESVDGKKIIQGVRGDLKSTIAATGYFYGLLTTQDLNCAL